jgi:hypothetical protein
VSPPSWSESADALRVSASLDRLCDSPPLTLTLPREVWRALMCGAVRTMDDLPEGGELHGAIRCAAGALRTVLDPAGTAATCDACLMPLDPAGINEPDSDVLCSACADCLCVRQAPL